MWANIALGLLITTILLSVSAETKYLQLKDGRRYNFPGNLVAPLAGEPSCDDLRVMWRFSRRQSRVAEITNEIPTYRDPFAYNVWDEYPRPRNFIGTVRSTARSWNRSPIYGRIIQNAPKNHPRIANVETSRAYEDVLRYFGNTNPGLETRRKVPGSAFRLTGGMPGPSPMSKSGSFQHLKQIIWAERAKELQQQRMLEGAAGLKHVQVPVQMSRAMGKQKSSSLYLPEEPEYAYNVPAAYYYRGPAYRKSYRFRPALEMEGEPSMERW